MTRKKKLTITGVVVLIFFVVAGAIVHYKQRHMPHFFTVKDDVLHRCGQPQWLGLTAIRMRGIKTVINLRKRGGHGMEKEEAFAKKHDIKFVLIPIGHSREEMVKTTNSFLEIMDKKENWPVLVHCSRGKERSGLLSAIYRIEYEGWSNQEAIYEMYNLGLDPGSMPIVEYFVWDYVPRNKRDGTKPKNGNGGKNLPEVKWQE